MSKTEHKPLSLAHKEDVHSIEDGQNSAFTCNWLNCNKPFVRLGDLVEHVNLAHCGSDKPWPRHFCNWEGCWRRTPFANQNNMIYHMRAHTGERPFECRLCGTRFSVRSNYNAHVRTVHAQPQLSPKVIQFDETREPLPPNGNGHTPIVRNQHTKLRDMYLEAKKSAMLSLSPMDSNTITLTHFSKSSSSSSVSLSSSSCLSTSSSPSSSTIDFSFQKQSDKHTVSKEMNLKKAHGSTLTVSRKKESTHEVASVPFKVHSSLPAIHTELSGLSSGEVSKSKKSKTSDKSHRRTAHGKNLKLLKTRHLVQKKLQECRHVTRHLISKIRYLEIAETDLQSSKKFYHAYLTFPPPPPPPPPSTSPSSSSSSSLPLCPSFLRNRLETQTFLIEEVEQMQAKMIQTLDVFIDKIIPSLEKRLAFIQTHSPSSIKQLTMASDAFLALNTPPLSPDCRPVAC